MLQVVVALTVQLNRLRAVWQIKKIPLFVDLYKHNMKLVILLQLLKLVSRNICKEEQIT